MLDRMQATSLRVRQLVTCIQVIYLPVGRSPDVRLPFVMIFRELFWARHQLALLRPVFHVQL